MNNNKLHSNTCNCPHCITIIFNQTTKYKDPTSPSEKNIIKNVIVYPKKQ